MRARRAARQPPRAHRRGGRRRALTLPLRRSLPHRLVAAAVIVLAAVTLVHAKEGTSRYTMQASISLGRGDNYTFDIVVRDRLSDEVVVHPRITTPAGVPAEYINNDSVPIDKVRVLAQKDGHAEVTLTVLDSGGKVIDGLRTVSTINKQTAAAISLNLKDGDLRDVIRTFGQLTGMETQIDPDVDGRVTAQFDSVPWDQALQKILFDNHCEYEIEGKTLHVRRMR